VVFIETPVFTKQVLELLSDYDYSDFQHYLAQNPEAGDVIKDTGGLRKIRWKTKGKGKSGGVRVIYFYLPSVIQIRLLLIYKKGVKDDLTSGERKMLRSINANW
jgi:mRNA-degrading endonuclease RelE of RelBE toxin-antitoxin system